MGIGGKAATYPPPESSPSRGEELEGGGDLRGEGEATTGPFPPGGGRGGWGGRGENAACGA